MAEVNHHKLDLHQIAQQGNTIAIALLLNRHLEPKGITAKVTVNSNCLKLMVESAHVPPQELVVEWLKTYLTNLNLIPINTVIVYGRKNGHDIPDWQGEFDLVADSNLPALSLEVMSEIPR